LDNLNIRLFNPIYLYIIIFKKFFGKITDNKLYDFSRCSEKCKFGKEYYEKFLELLNNYSNDFPEDIETSIYDNLKEVNIQKKENFLNIKDMMKDLIYDVESKKGFLALLKQSYLLGKLRNSIEQEYIIGVFGKKKAGKSTFIEKIFKKCETHSSYANSTIGLNLYTIQGIKNFAIIDSPGDTESNQNLELFSSKGYLYSKMIIYIISEIVVLNANSTRNNNRLKNIIEISSKYKIPLLILLTHSDSYCYEVKLSDEKNWEETCKDKINNNKKLLLEYINEIKIDIKMQENDIIHTVLVEPGKMTDEEIIKKFPKKTKEKYDKANDEIKRVILETFIEGMDFSGNEIQEFIEEEIKIYGRQKLIEKIKEKLPFQYHIL